MSQDTELGPCPRCGERAGELSVVASIHRYYVQCRKCDYFTKPAPLKEDALANWAADKPER